MELIERRRFYAEEIQAIANLTNASVVEALAAVPRERFLGPGPWTIRGEADFQQAPRQTADSDPRHVYHNLAVEIDRDRQLFNGAPGVVAMAIDRLSLKPGDRVLHIGCGTGYYTAVIAACVGSSGRVVAIEVDGVLAAHARENLASVPWVEVRTGNGLEPLESRFDGVLVNAGMTHPPGRWMEALESAGRMVLPLTFAMGPNIGKGLLLLLSRTPELDGLAAQVIGFVAIYSAIGVRDDAINAQIGQAMRSNPLPALKRLRLDPHDASPSCWLHTGHGCLSTT